jgi:hypothetical protein
MFLEIMLMTIDLIRVSLPLDGMLVQHITVFSTAFELRGADLPFFHSEKNIF